MKKLIVAAMALSTLFFVGCGGDDDDNGNGDTTITVTAGTGTAPASPLVYNDPVWTSVASTTIPISTSGSLPVSPRKSPMGPSKALAAPSSVDLQAIKKDGRLYLRFQWKDDSLSMQRDNWRITDTVNFNFEHDVYLGEDQLWVLFEGAPDGWDAWNWRVLTTGYANRAEDGTVSGGDTAWDEGYQRVASMNPIRNPVDSARPLYIDTSMSGFHGDTLFKGRLLNIQEQAGYERALAGRFDWTVGQTVPGWYINDDVIWAEVDDRRWEVQAVYNYDPGIGIPGRYTLVLARDLATGDIEDLDMADLGRVKTRIGVFDNYDDVPFEGGDSRRAFSADFWLVLP